MTATRRVQQQPAYVLHHRPFRDTSQLLDVISREYGKVTLVARGSRSAKSKLRGVLRPFQPLRLSWFVRSDLGTLTGAEIDAAPLTLRGDALLSAYYVNELVLNFLHRHDPQPDIFDAYAQTVAALARSGELAANLRVFEMELLRMLGYALNLDYDAHLHERIDEQRNYEYRVDQGAVAVSRSEGSMVFKGARLQGIAAARFEDPDVLRDAGRLLREVIRHHLEGRELKSRKVLLDLHRARMPKKRPPEEP